MYKKTAFMGKKHKICVTRNENSTIYCGKKKIDTLQAKDVDGGDKGDRTPDLLNASQALSQLSYTPRSLAVFFQRGIYYHTLFQNASTFLKFFYFFSEQFLQPPH